MEFKSRVSAISYEYRLTDGKRMIVVHFNTEDDIPIAEKEDDAATRNFLHIDPRNPFSQLINVKERRGVILFEEDEWETVKSLFIVNNYIKFELTPKEIRIKKVE